MNIGWTGIDADDPVGWSANERIARWPLQAVALATILAVVFWAIPLVTETRDTNTTTWFVSLGVIGLWRWSWVACHYLRAIAYRYAVFPSAARRGQAVEKFGPTPELAVLMATYKEHPEITRSVVRSLVRSSRCWTASYGRRA